MQQAILHGNLGTSFLVLDGWSYTESEDGFDSIEAEVIAMADGDLPQKYDDVSTDFGFDIAIVTERGSVTEEGDLYKAKIKAKGRKSTTEFVKVRAGASAQVFQRTIFEETITPGLYLPRTENNIRYNPYVEVSYVSTSEATQTIGDVETPPIIPVDPPTEYGLGTILNNPHGWVVEDIQTEVLGGSLPTPSASAYFHKIRYQWYPEYADDQAAP